MECNRDEAIRARDIAERKVAMRDFLGAKKFVVKAQQLYPALEGAAQLEAVVDVHSAAAVKVGGDETDWYGILQVEPGSDDSIIKKQYRKLALLLHPDKNQAKGAEAAFKLIGEAFGVLSDRNKRFLHDSKRGVGVRAANMASHVPGSSSAYQAQYQAAAQATAGNQAQAASPHSSLTFWTVCPICRMQYQYMRTYINQTLLCQKCHKPFLATDISAPAANGTTFTWNNGPFPTGPVPPAPRRAGTFNFQAWTSQNGGGGAPANGHARAYGGGGYASAGGAFPSGSVKVAGVSPATAAATANLVQEVYQRAQRERISTEKAELRKKVKEQDKLSRQREKERMKKAREQAKIQEDLQKMRRKREEAIEKEARRVAALKPGPKKRLNSNNKRKRDDDEDGDDEDVEDENLERSYSGHGVHAGRLFYHRTSDDDDGEAFPGAKKARTNGGDHVGHDSRTEKGKSVMDDGEAETWGDGGRDNRGVDSFSLLAETYRLHLRRKYVFPPNRPFHPGAKLASTAATGDTSSAQDARASPSSNVTNRAKKVKVNGAADAGDGSNEEQIDVPDSDFHDFDADRSVLHVKKNQVWAVYDDKDGMPRFYCQINKVSQEPFFVDGVWLEPTHPDKDSFTWINSRGLSLGTGDFRLGDKCDFDSINLFSHLMPIKKIKSGYEVYPKKLEAWAMFRDYNIETTTTDAEGALKLRYDFVLVVSEFMTITGQGRVVRLKKLAGFRTLWVPEGEHFSLSMKYDVQKFSHRVPALSVFDTDIEGVPPGCLELDPASAPVDAINPASTSVEAINPGAA